MASMLHAALDYAERFGWPVFPVWWPKDGICACPQGEACPSPAKHPLTDHGFKDASRDPNQIRRWWAKWPDSNIGIPTGVVSRLVVLDIDPANGGDETLRELEDTSGALPETVESVTGGGGRHLLFKYPHS